MPILSENSLDLRSGKLVGCNWIDLLLPQGGKKAFSSGVMTVAVAVAVEEASKREHGLFSNKSRISPSEMRKIFYKKLDTSFGRNPL